MSSAYLTNRTPNPFSFPLPPSWVIRYPGGQGYTRSKDFAEYIYILILFEPQGSIWAVHNCYSSKEACEGEDGMLTTWFHDIDLRDAIRAVDGRIDPKKLASIKEDTWVTTGLKNAYMKEKMLPGSEEMCLRMVKDWRDGEEERRESL